MVIRTHIFANPDAVAIFKRDDALPGLPVDDPVIADPLADISRVKYHSGIPYVSIDSGSIPTWSGSVNCPGAGSNQKRKYTLFAHGQSYTPLVFGKIINHEGHDLSFAGSILVHDNNQELFANRGFRNIALSADKTNVYLIEVVSRGRGTLSGQSFNIHVFVSDFGLA